MPARQRMSSQPGREPLEEPLPQPNFREIEQESQNEPIGPQRLALANLSAVVVEKLVDRRMDAAASYPADISRNLCIDRLGFCYLRHTIKTSLGQNKLRSARNDAI